MSCRRVLGQLYVEMMAPSSGTLADVIDSEDAGASLSSSLRLFSWLPRVDGHTLMTVMILGPVSVLHASRTHTPTDTKDNW